jgi:hypothetical protein
MERDNVGKLVHDGLDGGQSEDPGHLPPGLARREALIGAGIAVRFADFTREELEELLADLHEIRRATGLGVRRT